MQIAVLGIDLGKNSCSVVGLDSSGAVIKRRRMRPESIAAFTENAGLHRGDGGVLWRAPSWARDGRPGPPGTSDVAGVCSAVCEGAEER